MEPEFALNKFLEQHDITGYKLAQVAGISKQSIYNLTSKKDPPKSIQFQTLGKVVTALQEITGNKEIGVEDLLVYKPPPTNTAIEQPHI